MTVLPFVAATLVLHAVLFVRPLSAQRLDEPTQAEAILETDVAMEVLAQERRLAQAFQQRDRVVLERLLAQDYVLRGFPDVPRRQWITNAINLCWGKTFDISRFDAQPEGDRVVASFVFTFDQDPMTCRSVTMRSLITDIWVNVDGEWRLKLRHASGVAAPNSPEAVRLQFALVPPPPPVWQLESEFSFVATNGNSSTQTIGTTADLRHKKGPWDTTARGAFVRSTADGLESARSMLLDLRPGRVIAPGVTAFARSSFRRDLFAGIERRIALSAGIAQLLVQHPRHNLQFEGALGYEREGRVAVPELRFASAQGRLTYRWRVTPTVNTSTETTITGDLERAGNWRASNKASATFTVSRALSLKLSHQLEYLHEPVPGFMRLDTITSVGLVVTIRR